ncbi:MAG TPA: heme ABC exporter ATP-binding protein CcmA [Bacillota bacterium]|jgi:heme exporter protein A
MNQPGRPSAAAAIVAAGVDKRIGPKLILKDIDLTVERGRFLTILGPNGAGKTTLLRILTGLLRPTSGRVMVDGQDLAEAPAELRRRFGVISHHSYLYDTLTARENLFFYGRLYDVPGLDRRIDEVLAEVGLELFFNEPVRTFSRGMIQRLAIARAIIHRPTFLFLDEPYTGLDPQASETLSSVLAGLRHDERTIVMITHQFDQGLAMADRVVVLVDGRIALDEAASDLSLDELNRRYRLAAGAGGDRS